VYIKNKFLTTFALLLISYSPRQNELKWIDRWNSTSKYYWLSLVCYIRIYSTACLFTLILGFFQVHYDNFFLSPFFTMLFVLFPRLFTFLVYPIKNAIIAHLHVAHEAIYLNDFRTRNIVNCESIETSICKIYITDSVSFSFDYDYLHHWEKMICFVRQSNQSSNCSLSRPVLSLLTYGSTMSIEFVFLNATNHRNFIVDTMCTTHMDIAKLFLTSRI